MDTVKIDKKKTLMIAHRGVSGLESENTLESFMLACQRSYFGIETDLHVTKDDKFIVSHDDNTERMSGVNKSIWESTYDEIREIKIPLRNGGYTKFPNLNEYISLCKEFGKVAVLELKGDYKEENIMDVLEIIKSYDYLSNVVFISFHKNNLLLCKKHYPDGVYQYLNCIVDDEAKNDTIKFALENDFGVDVHYRNLNLDFCEKCKEHNIKFNVWTVDDPIVASRLINEAGVGFITSNILE